MPWKERTVETMREEFIQEVKKKEKTISALCREHGISRPTGYKWLKRHADGESMSDRSRAPKQHGRRTSEAVEQKIVAYREQYPAIGAVKLRQMLQDEGDSDLPSAKTFNNIFKRNGLITKEASLAAKPYQRFEREQPNQLWQADFKGHFALGNGERCHTLNVVDDCTRFNLCCEPLHGETYEETIQVFLRLFREYGLPSALLCDNGNPWGTAQSAGFTRFEVDLMELGVLTLHGRVRHPQTQGKDESFNRSFTRECLKYRIPDDNEDACVQFGGYRDFYNWKRPHHALQLATPGSVYIRSNREMPGKILPWEYGPEYEIRRVKDTGYFNYKNAGFFLSEAFASKEIAIRESRTPGQIVIVFRQFLIARIDLEKRVYTLRRAYLLENDPRNIDR
ncbi:MAG: IS481 family transposase [Oscillospiraceae bacterium]|nr:IS481 family transposase [Oscillospiraceae bacterium]